MKILLLTIAVFIPVLIFAEDTDKDKKSVITAVTLFKDRAFITRQKKLHLKAGTYSVEFENVTPRIERDSLKVTSSEKKAVRIMGVRTEEHFKKIRDNKKLDQLTTEKEKLERERNLLFEEVASVLKENDYLAEISLHYRESFAINLHKKNWSKNEFEHLFSLLKTRSFKLVGKWKSLFESYQILKDKIDFISAKIKEVDSDSNSQVTSVMVDIEVTENIDGTLDIQYLVMGPGWSPAYDVRIDSEKNIALIEINALVSQKSGEDWDNVLLTLSNLQTEIKPVVPSIQPYSISWREVKNVTTSISTQMDDAADLSMQEGLVGGVEGLAKNFIIKHRQTLKDGSQGSKVIIESGRFPYREHLELVPSQYLRVYKKAEMINEFPWTLAAGDVTVYYDGALVQTTTIEAVPKAQKFYLNTGIDHSILVNYWHDSIEDKKNSLGNLSKKNYARTYHTYLENFSKSSKKIKVLAQIPLSEIKEVEVSNTGSTKDLKELKGFPSWSYWDVDLGAREKKSLDLSLSVNVPASFQFAWP